MRYNKKFNTTGICIPSLHYMVAGVHEVVLGDKILIEAVV